MYGSMKKHIAVAVVAVLTLTACDKVSPTGLLIAGSDVDDRVKMSHQYFQEHKGDFHIQSALGDEYTFLVGADSHITDDTGRMTEMLDMGIEQNDLFIAHLGDIADTKAEYYINLDNVLQKAREKYVKKNYLAVTAKDEQGGTYELYYNPSTHERKRMEDYTMPFYPVVGNHDITNNGWALWADIFHSSFYTVYIFVGSEEGKNVYDHLLFLDTASGTMGREQINLLNAGALDEMTDDDSVIRHTFVFGHTNIFRVSATELASTFAREETFYLLKMFDKWDADIVFCGHVHQWGEEEVGGVTYLTLDTMCEKNNPAPGDYLVRVHCKKDGSITWERVRMNYTKR